MNHLLKKFQNETSCFLATVSKKPIRRKRLRILIAALEKKIIFLKKFWSSYLNKNMISIIPARRK